jgi:hypothetical protein
MPVFSLSPAFVVVSYHSVEAPHKMTLPTLAWDQLGGTSGNGGYVAWDNSNRDADDMIKDFVTLLAEITPSTTTYDSYQIYTKASALAPNILRAEGPLAIAGTSGATYAPATQATFNLRTRGFHHAKIVLLDVEAPADFAPTFPSALSTDQGNVFANYALDSNAWAGRDNEQIDSIQRITWTLNEALRRAYRLN